MVQNDVIVIDHIEDHYERLEQAITNLYCLFEEYGLEVNIYTILDKTTKSINYYIRWQKYQLIGQIKTWESYEVTEKKFECYKLDDIEENNYIWIDTTCIKNFIKTTIKI